MSTQGLFWPAEQRTARDRGPSHWRMSHERGERSEREHLHEHHRERAASGEGSERREPRERGEWRERRERRERGERGRRYVGRGDVYAATLLLLEEQALHGYQIMQLIEQQSSGRWRPSAGSVYPALQLLEDQGYVQGEEQENRRVFHLTDSGRGYVAEHRSELVAAREAVTARLDRGDTDLWDVFAQVETAFKQVVQVGTPAQLSAARDLLVTARRQLYRLLADEAE
jgi:DNA-binding PadR family transcriptional regulator